MAGFFDAPLVLTDGGIETRIMYEFKRALNDFAAFELLDDAEGRSILREIYAGYVEVAQRYKLPIQLGTPTWRASERWTGDVERVNRDAVRFLRDLTKDASVPVAVAGVIGPSHDGYDPSAAIDAERAHAYHRRQAAALAEAGADLLYAPTFPAIGELHGAARAMAETKRPFAVAPMIDERGIMLDGTPLARAIAQLDDDAAARPWHYMLGCLYPTHAQTALEALFRASPAHAHRVVGLKANASPLSAEELDRLDRLDRRPAAEFAGELLSCAQRFGLHVLGGCCGTDAADIAAIAALATAAV